MTLEKTVLSYPVCLVFLWCIFVLCVCFGKTQAASFLSVAVEVVSLPDSVALHPSCSHPHIILPKVSQKFNHSMHQRCVLCLGWGLALPHLGTCNSCDDHACCSMAGHRRRNCVDTSSLLHLSIFCKLGSTEKDDDSKSFHNMNGFQGNHTQLPTSYPHIVPFALLVQTFQSSVREY